MSEEQHCLETVLGLLCFVCLYRLGVLFRSKTPSSTSLTRLHGRTKSLSSLINVLPQYIGRGGKELGIWSFWSSSESDSSASFSLFSESERDMEETDLGEVSEAVGLDDECVVLGCESGVRGRVDTFPLRSSSVVVNNGFVRADLPYLLCSWTVTPSRTFPLLCFEFELECGPPPDVEVAADRLLPFDFPLDAATLTTADGRSGLGIMLGSVDAQRPDLMYCFPYEFCLAFVRTEVLVCLALKELAISSPEDGDPEAF